MKRLFNLMILLAVSNVFFASQPFGTGNLVIYRVGDGVNPITPLTIDTAYLDEYNVTGQTPTLVQTLMLPTETVGANKRMGYSHFKFEGWMTRSEDKRFLVVPGYDAQPGSVTEPAGPHPSGAPCVVGLVNVDGNIDSKTAATDAFDNVNYISAASSDGTDLWMGGTNISAVKAGVYYVAKDATTSQHLGGTTSGSTPAIRQVRIYKGQLYASRQNYIYKVGDGLPKESGQTFTKEIDFTKDASGTAKTDFLMIDFNPGESDPKTVCYTLDDVTGLSKHSLVAGAWIYNGSYATTNFTSTSFTWLRRIEGKMDQNGDVTLFIISKGDEYFDENKLFKFTDTAGHNEPINGTAPTTLLTYNNDINNSTNICGMAWAPEGPSSVTSSKVSELKVSVANKIIYVSNPVGKTIEVYDVFGRIVKTQNAIEGTNMISGLKENQFYVLKSGEQLVKVCLF